MAKRTMRARQILKFFTAKFLRASLNGIGLCHLLEGKP